jgi:hypothetical protein
MGPEPVALTHPRSALISEGPAAARRSHPLGGRRPCGARTWEKPLAGPGLEIRPGRPIYRLIDLTTCSSVLIRIHVDMADVKRLACRRRIREEPSASGS